MFDAFSIVVRHTNATLPDSIALRKELLLAMLDTLPKKHPTRVSLGAHLAALNAAETLQQELAERFEMGQGSRLSASRRASNDLEHDAGGKP